MPHHPRLISPYDDEQKWAVRYLNHHSHWNPRTTISQRGLLRHLFSEYHELFGDRSVLNEYASTAWISKWQEHHSLSKSQARSRLRAWKGIMAFRFDEESIPMNIAAFVVPTQPFCIPLLAFPKTHYSLHKHVLDWCKQYNGRKYGRAV